MNWLTRTLVFFLWSAVLCASEPPGPLWGFNKVYELTGSVDQPMIMPTDIAIGSQGRVYIVDSGNNRVVCYSERGEYLFEFGSAGEGKGQLLGPVGITTAPDGSVLVADRGNRRIQIFNELGEILASIPTKLDMQYITPVDVAVDAGNRYLYVTASKPHHKILVYGGGSGKGEVKSTWGKPGSNPGEFRFPATIARGPDENLYIVDVFNSRIQVLRPTGEPLSTVGSWGITPGHLFRPKGIAINQKGLVAVSDSYLGVVQLFDDNTRFQAVLGENGDFAHFTTPTGLAFDHQGRLYIAEMLANRVTVLEIEQ